MGNMNPWLEKKIFYKFKNEDLLNIALVHHSCRRFNPNAGSLNNERLEFLGDSVLSMIVAKNLFFQHPNYDEGRLTNLRAALVKRTTLFAVAREIELEKHLLTSLDVAKNIRVESKDVGLSDAVEALIAAIYLDGGYERAAAFVNRFIMPKIKDVAYGGKEPKTVLQEMVQTKLGTRPHYDILREEGSGSGKIFTVGVWVRGKLIAAGRGVLIRDAEAEAAKEALKNWPA